MGLYGCDVHPFDVFALLAALAMLGIGLFYGPKPRQ
jgi:hypothetical protein